MQPEHEERRTWYAARMPQTPPLGTPKSPPDGARDVSTKTVPSVSTKSLPSPLWSKPSIWVGIALAAVAIAYGVGRLQGAQALSSAEERHATALATARSNLGACEIDRTLLNARRSLALVALSLDRRNFGVAESHRREASQALEQPGLSGLPEVGNLSTTIRGLNLNVDPDPGAKRERVIAASEALDRLLVARAPAGLPAPATTAAKGAP